MWAIHAGLLVPVLLLSGICQAEPSCGPADLEPCALPYVIFGSTPLGKEIRSLEDAGQPENVTESQVRELCKVYQGIATCVANHVTRCINDTAVDNHLFMQGSVKMLEICDQPNLLSQYQTLTACGKVLVPVSGLHVDRFFWGLSPIYPREGFPASFAERDGMQIWIAVHREDTLSDVCCGLKQIKANGQPNIELCKPEAAALRTKLINDLWGAYGCAGQAETCWFERPRT